MFLQPINRLSNTSIYHWPDHRSTDQATNPPTGLYHLLGPERSIIHLGGHRGVDLEIACNGSSTSNPLVKEGAFNTVMPHSSIHANIVTVGGSEHTGRQPNSTLCVVLCLLCVSSVSSPAEQCVPSQDRLRCFLPSESCSPLL